MMIYTAIVGSIDAERKDIHVYSDRVGFESDRMNAKIYKVLSHHYTVGPSLWVDGNISVKVAQSEVIYSLLFDADLAVFKHPFRSSIADEYKEIKALKLKGVMPDFPPKFKDESLYECNVIVRRNNAVVRRFNEVWWSLICRYPERDQVTFPIALNYVPELRVQLIPGVLRKDHPWFKYVKHGESLGLKSKEEKT